VGRKASGPEMMGSGVARPMDKQTLKPILSLREWAFFFRDSQITIEFSKSERSSPKQLKS